MALFSVVIPLYNKADTIERAIRSVWSQSFKDYELIVVNDGSTDDSLNLVKRLSQEKGFVIIDKKNGGVSSARNAGANVASSKYIAFLDADDWWDDEYLSEIVAIITRFPDAICAGTGFYFYLAGNLWKTKYTGQKKMSFIEKTAIFQPLHTSSIVIKRDCFNTVGGFNLEYGFYEDLECFFRLELRFPNRTYISGRALSYHMDDALYSITKENNSLQTPHLKVVEAALSNDASKSRVIKRFAQRYALFRLSDNSRRMCPECNWKFQQEYPLIVSQISAWRLFTSDRLKFCAWCLSIIILCVHHILLRFVIAPVKNCKGKGLQYGSTALT